MKRKIKWAVAVLALILVAMQFVPVNREAGAVESDVPAPPDVKAVLRRGCYDCHSNETVWPVYSRVAPVSWIMAGHVEEGRDHLNLSTWGRLTDVEQLKIRQKMWREVDHGVMPPWYYVPFHPASRLSADDKTVLRDWATAGAPAR